ncbi:MAG: OmpA family protein [Cryomorphaceae bacterium]|nr:OmpA family protein [Cryomorphaceae bacterium]
MKKQLLALFGFVILTSCVSQKKHQIALNEVDRLREDSLGLHQAWNSCGDMYDSVRYAYEDYKKSSERNLVTLMAQLDEKSADIMEKEGILSERAAKLRELQEQVNRQNVQMENIRKTLREALVDIPAKDLQVEIKDGKIYINLSENLLFSSGSALVDTRGKDALKSVADILNKNRDIQIEVIGHTDSVPIRTARFSDNWDLSVARATSITRILVDEYGVSGQSIKASGRSEYRPVTGNKTVDGRARNRRTEIILSPNLEKLFQLMESD